MKIAFISDIHMDFYIHPKNNGGHKLKRSVKNFIEEELYPKEADILLIGGDNSHYNIQTKELLTQLSELKLFKHIFITFGNHDLYLISSNQESNYKVSWNKIEELKQICNEFEDVTFLDGNIVEIDGVKIGGCGMWYDFSYGTKFFGKNKDDMLQLWKDVMNDANYIKGNDKIPQLSSIQMYSYKTKQYNFDPLKFFNNEKEKLVKIISEVDVMLSHFGPVVPPNLEPQYAVPSTGFYYFDGEHLLMNEKTPKMWVFGHTHTRYDFKVNNTWLMCNPLGYASERTGNEIVVVDLNDL